MRKTITEIIGGRFNTMSTQFSVEESNLICIYAGENREDVIEDINGALPYLDDEDLVALSHRVLNKLQNMTDEEFAGLSFEPAEHNN